MAECCLVIALGWELRLLCPSKCWPIRSTIGAELLYDHSLLCQKYGTISDYRYAAETASLMPRSLENLLYLSSFVPANFAAMVGLFRVSLLMVTSCALSLAKRRFLSVPNNASFVF